MIMPRQRSIVGVLLLLAALDGGALAGPSKTDCKGHAAAVKDLVRELNLPADATGRELMQAVQAWIAQQQPATVERVTARIEQATRGIRECEAGGFSTIVLPVKATSLTLETAVLPWLRNAVGADSCQGMINEAVRARSDDVDRAIELLRRSIAECGDDGWRAEAQRHLAATHYQRGAVEQDDFRLADEATREALRLSGGLASADPTLRASLARPAIEAGQKLMEHQDWETARRHWTAYTETFGTPSFDVLFAVDEAAQGAWTLRELKDARHQLVLACLGTGDLDCVRGAMLPVDPAGDVQPLRDVTRLTFERAASASGAAGEALLALGFELLTGWHQVEPDGYGIDVLLQQSLVERGDEERRARLGAIEQCWIPLRVVELLRREGREFLPELEQAATCAGAGSEARQELSAHLLRLSGERLDRIVSAGSVQAQRAVVAEIEEQILPRVTEPADAEALRRRIADARERVRDESSQSVAQTAGVYAGCTELLATIQWNKAREREYAQLEIDFRRDCCAFLRVNTDAWVSWMRSRPEKERLQDAEIDNKRRLMDAYCDPSGR